MCEFNEALSQVLRRVVSLKGVAAVADSPANAANTKVAIDYESMHDYAVLTYLADLLESGQIQITIPIDKSPNLLDLFTYLRRANE